MARSSGRPAGYGCHGGGAAACCSRAPRNERSPPASLRAAKRSWPPSTSSMRSPRASAFGRGAMSAMGVGVGLVEVSRVAAIIADKGSRVFERLLTPAERAYCESRPDPATHVAVRLAAKEAAYKALQGSEAAR